MPNKARRSRQREAREFEALLSTLPPHLKGINSEVNQDLIDLLGKVIAEEGRRAAANAGGANAKRSAAATIRLAEFSAKHAELLAKNQSARWIAQRIQTNGADNRSVEAIAIDVRKAKKIKKHS